MSTARIGDICEIGGQINFEWKIKDFFQLSDVVDVRYESPKFYCFGTSWEICLYPNGQVEHKSEGWIAIYLMRTSFGSPITVNFSFGLKNNNGKTDLSYNFTRGFVKKNNGLGTFQFISRSVLMERKSELISSDALTIICTLQNSERNDVSDSLFCRLQEMSDHFKEIFEKDKQTDFLLKVEGQNLGAHRLVLGTRSPVFDAMFAHDTKENQTGEVSIPDVDKNTMKKILMYMYSGDIDELTTENAISLYAAADKYGIKYIKEICLRFILKNLSVESLYEVIKFAELYQEEEASLRAREYFKENASTILKSDSWKTFLRENTDIGAELLSTTLQSVLEK